MYSTIKYDVIFVRFRYLSVAFQISETRATDI